MLGDSTKRRPSQVDSISGGARSEATERSASCRLAWLLAVLATMMLEIASSDGDRPIWATGLIVCVEVVSATALSFGCWRIDRAAGTLTKSRLIPVLCLATGPFVLEVLARIGTGAMLPLELLLLSYIRNAVLALAVFAYRDDCRRLCCALSMYLVIFCSPLSGLLWMHALVVVFAIAGIWWLMATYWESLQYRLVASSERDLPRRWLIAMPLFLLSTLVAVPVAGTPLHALWGFMPSSGGMDWYSEAARQGVGDGDALVAGTEHVQSFAPIDDAPFMTSHEPSLYDLFDDSYNEPVKSPKSDRAIALPPELARNRPKERQLAESKQAGREFSTLRKPGPRKQSLLGNRDSAALLYVKGRVPLHLKLEVFDLYDGIEWFPEPLEMAQGELKMESLNGRPWLRMPVGRSLDLYAIPESHGLKVIHLDTNRVPSPTQLLGVHVDKVDRLDFFKWAQPDIVRMDRNTLPPLTVIHVQSRVPDERRVPAPYLFLQGGGANHRQVGDDTESERIRTLARLWTQDVSPGWDQIREVVAHVRTEYEHDRQKKPPADCNHTVSNFLFGTRRGPDYLFASSTVLLLRSLGYSARLVSGLYADPSRYEVRSRHTAVLGDDVHFWAEVRVGPNDWIPLEPTPGYEQLRPLPTLVEQLQASLFETWRFIVDRAVVFSCCVVAMIGLFFQRVAAADWVMTSIWRIVPVGDERDFVRRTMRLLNSRASGIGRPCPQGVTPSRWLSRLASPDDSSARSLLRELTRLSDWAAFAPDTIPAPVEFPRDVCRNSVNVWSRKRMIQIALAGPVGRMQSGASTSPHETGLILTLRHDGACLSGGISG